MRAEVIHAAINERRTQLCSASQRSDDSAEILRDTSTPSAARYAPRVTRVALRVTVRDGDRTTLTRSLGTTRMGDG
jgi:hypothetical protein